MRRTLVILSPPAALVVTLAFGLILGFTGLGGQSIAEGSTTSILVLDTSTCDTQIIGALAGAAFTEVSPVDFATAELTAYDVLYVGATFRDGSVTQPSQAALDALNGRQSDIADFVESGHGVVALSEPIGDGRYTWLPVGVTPSARDDKEQVHIVQPGHPVMDGLTDGGLSNWNSSYHHIFTDAGSLTVLALGVEPGNLPVILGGTFGGGKMVIMGQDPDWHYCGGAPGQELELVQNAVDWVAGHVATPMPTITPVPTRTLVPAASTLTPTPTSTPPPCVGGTVKLPPGVVAAEAGAQAGDFSWGTRAYAALAGGLGAAFAALGVGGWYVRRRRLP
jgi:hypothetical protein